MRQPSAFRHALGLALLLLGIGAAHAAPALPLPAATKDLRVAQAIAEASARFSIPPSWIRAVMQVESGGNERALSPKGAVGLMQIMPATWEALRRRYRLGADPYDAHDNILAGTALLRELYDRFGAGGFLAAYNAGPARYLAFLGHGQPLNAETQLCLAKLAALLPELQIGGATFAAAASPDWRTASLFAQAWPAPNPPVSAASRPGGSSAAALPSATAFNGNSDANPLRLSPNTAALFVALTPSVSP